MGKIDYSKVEREMSEALLRIQAKQLGEGKPITSKRAAEFFGLEDKTPRPAPEDSVESLIAEEAALAEKALKAAEAAQSAEAAQTSEAPQAAEQPDTEEEEFEEPPQGADVLITHKKRSSRVPKRAHLIDLPQASHSDSFVEPLSPLYVLRQHIFWLKRQRFDNRYELLGTTREEIMAFRRTPRLSKEQLQRIRELNVRAEEVRRQLMKKHGAETNDSLVERQKKVHRHKRFNIKEGWMPL